MCGIVVIFSYKKDSPGIDKVELKRMREHMANRGPDGEGLWISEQKKIGLAHRRLSIIDLSKAAHQPMSIEDGRYRIVFNGEIYNYRSLRQRLESDGCNFHSTSDTEVLLHLYAKRGIDMVNELRGMFAFAIWDEKKRGLFLARDPFGIKPLYIHDDGKIFRCASQVKALMSGNGIDRKIEPAGHVGFFLWGSVPEPFTLYRDVFALPAGHTLWVDENGPRAPKSFFNIVDELVQAAGQPSRHKDLSESFSRTLRDSLRHHLIADVPVGVFLSSGVDSGTLLALASEEMLHLKAITLGFREYTDSEQDETPLATTLANRYGSEHTIELITQHDFKEELPNILEAMDQPTIDGVNTYFVSRAAAKAGLKVALSGLGGDELLGGYPGFNQIPKVVSYSRIPAALPCLGKVFRLLSAPLVKHFTSPKYAGLLEYGGTFGGAYLLRRSLFMPWELSEFLDPDLVREGWETLQPVIRLDDEVSGLDHSHAKISALELTHYMRNTLLRDSDWAGMAHSLEIRTPLVDIEVFRALAPYLNTGNQLPSKKTLARTPSEPLPEEIIQRRKTGFSIPVQDWMTTMDRGREHQQRGLRGWALRVFDAFKSKDTWQQDRRKRVMALVSDAFGAGGGIAKFNRDFLTAASASPLVSSVVAITRVQPKPARDLPLKLHYDSRGIGMNARCLSGKLRYTREVARMLWHYKQIDLVVCGLISMLPIAFLATRIKGAPLWCEIYGIDAWEPHHSMLVNWLIHRIDGFTSISEYTKMRFLAWSGVEADKVHLLPNGYDPIKYGMGPKPEYLLDRYGLSGKCVLMTLGRLAAGEQYKGFDELIECLPQITSKIPNVVYLIAGDGDDRKRLQQKASRLGLANRVIFTGFVPETEKADHYRLADVYVMPSRGEGFGFVLLEAMACGIPTVASKLDGSRDAVRNGQLGILADPTDLQDVKNAVLSALKMERSIPSGLDYFSIGNYRDRTWRILSKLFAGKENKP